jgi:hypothetical protein
MTVESPQMSANHVDPDLASEIYVLDGPPD